MNTVSTKDLCILRNLAGRIAEIANSPLMAQRRQAWKDLNGLRGGRPMIVVETSGANAELGEYRKTECEGEWARSAESALRDRLFHFDVVGDDIVIDATLNRSPPVTNSGFGVESVKHHGDAGDHKGSMSWDPPLKVLPDDLSKLRFREFAWDVPAVERELDLATAVFDGLLTPHARPFVWWTQGLTITAIDLFGLEALMLAMFDNPEGLHALMAFLRDETQNMLDWHEKAGVLYPNNRDDYFGSGGCGYTDELPQSDHVPGTPWRIKDMWGLSESQETVGVSPEMFEEFVFPYQLPIIERFGLAYYGCCEPLDSRWHIVRRIRNLRAVSVSPWSDVEKMAEHLGHNYVYCRKPNPSYVSAGWNEDIIRQDLRRTLEVTKGLSVQLVLKDVHTVNGEPRRFGRWVEIAREEIARVYDGNNTVR